MKFLEIIIIIFLTILFQSCDPGGIIKFKVLNKTSKPIKVKYNLGINGDTSMQNIEIPANASRIINEINHLGFAKEYDSLTDSIDISVLELTHQDKLIKRNFKDKRNWIFSEMDDLNATYKLIIDSSFFK